MKNNQQTADCIGIRILRRDIANLEIKCNNINKAGLSASAFGLEYERKLKKKIKELTDLGYEHIPNWVD